MLKMSDHAPSWLQAFAAVTALVISVWATLRVGMIERRRDRLQARAIAVSIYLELLKLKVATENTRSLLEDLVNQYKTLVGQSIASRIELCGHIPLPAMLDRNVDKLYLLGKPAGPSCLQLAGVLLQYGALLQDVVMRISAMGEEDWTEALRHLDEHLALLLKVTAKCLREVKPIHDSVRG